MGGWSPLADDSSAAGGVVAGEPVVRRGLDESARRSLRTETIVVLAISLGQSAVYSVLRIIERLTRPEPLGQQTTSMNNSATPDRPWLDLVYQLAAVGFGVVPALLVIHLVRTRFVPAQGAGVAMGLAPRRWGFDIAWGFGLGALIGIPGLGLYLGAKALGLNTTIAAANLTEVWWTIPVLCLLAAMNGILEEVVMVGYLFTRWLQIGWQPWVVLVASALVRGSYHLYQGFGGFIGNVIMGLILGVFFLKFRRVWPLVICHTVLDIASFVGYALLKPHVTWL